ncbi:unnamed protein product [Schistosoma curassoni]|nr:unnamed protein product [Schistosoma curassoni]
MSRKPTYCISRTTNSSVSVISKTNLPPGSHNHPRSLSATESRGTVSVVESIRINTSTVESLLPPRKARSHKRVMMVDDSEEEDEEDSDNDAVDDDPDDEDF